MNKFINKKIAILWYGKEWKSSLKFLQKIWVKNSDITILDKNNFILEEWLNWIFWEKYLSNLDIYDYIFKTPWISPFLDKLINYRDKIITGAMMFFEFYKWKIISITQTKGKSTTTTLIYNLLKNAWFNTKIVWNIWHPVLDEIDIFNDKYDFIVYELSSYMLQDLNNHHSYISILWNIFPDHLDWHLSFGEYSKAKKNVIINAWNILIWDELFKRDFIWNNDKNIETFGDNWKYYHKLNDFYIWSNFIWNINPKIKWNHNLNNISWVLAVSHIVWIDFEICKKTIESFEWLPHRMQNIGEYDGIIFIDDAISTTPESTIEAIKTFNYDVDTIFLWWTDRWYEFYELIKELNKYNIKNIVLFPDSSQKILKLLGGSFNYIETKSMEEAIKWAKKYTKKWKIVLLSTASPSYSIWKNFEEKWDLFAKYAKQKQE